MNPLTAKNEMEYIIRQPSEEDAEAILTYARELFAESDQVLTTLEEYTITVEQERKWISSFHSNPTALILVAEVDHTIVGLATFMTNIKKKEAHTGELGVSVSAGYRGKGIGRALMERILEWAKNNQQVEKVYLRVFNTNHNAIALYTHLGFKEEGRHVKAIKQPTGEYVDTIQMYIEV